MLRNDQVVVGLVKSWIITTFAVILLYMSCVVNNSATKKKRKRKINTVSVKLPTIIAVYKPLLFITLYPLVYMQERLI